MTRIVHITVHQPGDSRDLSTRGAGSRSRGTGDPGEGYVQPDPIDPGSSYVQPDPTDPASSYVQPDPTDPESGYVQPDPIDPDGIRPYGGVRVYESNAASQLPGLSHGPCCRCCCDDDSENDQGRPEGGVGRDYSGFVIVRLKPNVGLEFESLWQMAKEEGLTALVAALELVAPEPDEPGIAPLPDENRADVEQEQVYVRYNDEPRHHPEPRGVLVSRPLIDLYGRILDGDVPTRFLRQRKDTLALIRALEQRAANHSLRPRHSLASYWRVDLRPYPDRVGEVVTALQGLSEVDLAYRELVATDPQEAPQGDDYAEDQAYLDRAPVGVGARWAAKQLAQLDQLDQSSNSGQPPVILVDVEQGWEEYHKDLKNLGNFHPTPVYGANRAGTSYGPGHHGTAVLGQLAPLSGVEGAAASVAEFRLASHYRGGQPSPGDPFADTEGHVAAAIVNALATPGDFPSGLDPTAYAATSLGDILLLEVQRALLPTEVDEADLDAIRLATALGVTVVEAAGNGGQDLDRYRHPVTGRALNRRSSAFVDSGAVMVGAAFAALPHDWAPFSNFGTRLDCYGWGESVTSCGYGDLDGGNEPTQAYTNTFSGTSSAAPMIAGAAALLQGLHRRQTGNSLAPLPLRALLADPATGTPQGPNVGGFIGVMPDLEALVQDHLQLAPHLYLRKHPCDDGSAAGEDAVQGSCPDIVVLRNQLVDSAAAATNNPTGNELKEALSEDGERANDPAPGWRVRHNGGKNWLFLRVRNRGLGLGKTSATFFWSPAATFIPPERWCLVKPTDPEDNTNTSNPPNLIEVPQGDRLTVMPPVPWHEAPSPPTPQTGSIWITSNASPPKPNPTHNCSLLAVLHPAPEDTVDPPAWPPHHSTPLLPPGGSYFDWAAYRAFLRRPDVGWRNIYQVQAGKPIRRLAFYIAGTPDRERHFDLEVLQRLPAGARVRLQLKSGLASKLRQRQPLLAGGDPNSLDLLPRPRVRFSRLCLAAGLYAPALLEVEAPKDSIEHGHSVAIRQLWRGEEVGRVTWFFKS